MSTPLIRAWYAIAVSFFACLVVAVGSVGYASHVQKQAEQRAELARQKSDRRWCDLLVSVGDAQQDTPPATASGRRFAEEIAELRRSFGCTVR